jgi:hypothetical protein
VGIYGHFIRFYLLHERQSSLVQFVGQLVSGIVEGELFRVFPRLLQKVVPQLVAPRQILQRLIVQPRSRLLFPIHVYHIIVGVLSLDGVPPVPEVVRVINPGLGHDIGGSFEDGLQVDWVLLRSGYRGGGGRFTLQPFHIPLAYYER